MSKTNINAIEQTIKRSLHSMYKHQFSIEQYQIFLTFALSVWCMNVIYVLSRGYEFFSSAVWYKNLEHFLPVHSLLTSSKMPRRNRIPFEHRERIIRAFDDEEEDYLLVAYAWSESINVKRHRGALHQIRQDPGETKRW